jgi:type IV pilus assembly protein PilM
MADVVIKKYNDIIGLDSGASSLKLVWMRKDSPTGEVRGTSIRKLPKTDVSASLRGNAPLVEIVKLSLSEMGCTAKKVFLCISGLNFYTKRISVVSMPHDELKEAVNWAVKDQISLNLDKVIINYHILSETKDEQAAGQMHILVAVAEKERVLGCINTVVAAGLVPVGVTLGPFALGAFFEGVKDGSVQAVLDIGSAKTELTLFKDGMPQFSRLLPGSGSEFTNAMTTTLVSDHGRLELGYEEAEALKIGAGIPTSESGAAKEGISNMQLLAMVRPVLEKLTSEIKRSFEYGKLQLGLPLPDRIYLTGGGSLLKNLDKILQKDLGVEVEGLGALSKQSVFLDTAYAAALEESKRINLLPQELIQQRARRIQRTSLKFMSMISASALLLSYFFMSFQVYNLKKQIGIASANYNAMQEVMLLKDKKDKVKVALARLYSEQYDSAAILTTLSEIIDSSIELDGFECGENGLISMKGTVASARPEGILANFIKSIRDSAIFTNVKIVSLQKDTTQYALSRFVVSCEVKESKADYSRW